MRKIACRNSVLLAIWMGSSVALAAADASRVVRFDIAAQSLPTALAQFSSQASIQFTAPSSSLNEITSTAVRGEYSTGKALDLMLQGTGLTYRFVDESTVAIRPQGKPLADARAAKPIRLAQSSAVPPPADSSEVAGSGTISEVVVTAQKREERAQDVPISISVLSGENLDASTSQGISETLRRVPGVSLDQQFQGGGTQITIRGAAAAAAAEGGSSPTAYYLDTVPFGFVRNALAPDSNAFDLDRVEVLRGPQGTLYGASALNGVVRVLTREPDLDSLEFKARTAASSTSGGNESYRGDMALNVPLVEGKVGARLVLGYQDVGGWIETPVKDNVNDGVVRNYRLKLKAQPTERLTVGLSAWIHDDYFEGPSWSNEFTGEQTSIGPQPVSTEYEAYGLQVAYDFPSVSVSSATSYMDYTNVDYLDVAFGGPPFTLITTLPQRVFSEEILLSSTSAGPWRWTAGVFYRDARGAWFATLPAWQQPLDYFDTSESKAVFGEVTRAFHQDRLELTLGLRRFEDDVETTVNTMFTEPYVPFQSYSFSATTPRVVLTWKPNPDLSLYGSYSQGFRSGVGQLPWLLGIVPDLPPAKPDKLNNYEIGAKGNVWSDRVAFDLALYYIDWKDTQQNLQIPVGNGLFSGALVNSENASGIGVDIGLSARPIDALELGLTFSWNDLTFDENVFSAGAILFNSGDRLNLSAEYTTGANADYVFAIGSGGLKGRVAAAANYTSAIPRVHLLGNERRSSAGDPIFNGRASFSIESARNWVGTLFVDNVTNEDGIVVRFSQSPDWSTRVRPRTVGLQLEYSF